MTAPPPPPNAPRPPGGPPPGGDLSGVRPQTDNDKLLGALCYIFAILVPIIILATDMKNSRFARVHAYQGLVFAGIAIGYSVIICVCLFVIALGTGGIIGFVLDCLSFLLMFIPVIAGIYFAFLVYTREQVVLPIITDLTRSVFKDV